MFPLENICPLQKTELYGFFILKNYEKLEKLKEIWKLEGIVLNAKKIIKKIGDDILIISKYGKQEKIVFILIIFQSWIVIDNINNYLFK